MTSRPPSRRDLAVLVVGQDLDAGGSAASDSLQPLTRSSTHEVGGPVMMTTLPLPAELVGDVPACIPVPPRCCRSGPCASAPLAVTSKATRSDPGRTSGAPSRALSQWDRQQSSSTISTPGGDEVVDLGGLLVQVIVGPETAADLDFAARQFIRFGLSAFLHAREEARVPQVADGHADRREIRWRKPGPRGEWSRWRQAAPFCG